MVFLEDLSDVLYGGIRSDVPGHGGAECAAYLPKSRVLLETAMSTAMMVGFGAYAVKTYTMPSRFPKMEEPLGKRFLLVLLCLVFGMEVGYKIISKQVLYLLNPCHVMTVVQASAVLHSNCKGYLVSTCMHVCLHELTANAWICHVGHEHATPNIPLIHPQW